MIFTPWAISLSLCSVMMIFLLLRVAVPALMIIYRGETGDSEFQLGMEKQEMLASAIFWLVGVYFIVSPFFLSAAAFDIGKQIPGAMCALGTFNANTFGYPLLFVRLWSIFFVISWMVLYAMDMHTTTTPFRKPRRVLIIFLLVWLLLDTILQTLFFYNINPTVITSCCAVVFDPTGTLTESPVGLLARYPSGIVFFSVAGVYILFGSSILKFDVKTGRLGYGLLAPIFFFFGISAMISCISPYIYALPHHHCPFCIMTGKEGWIGIPLMMSLYVGGLAGWYAGVWELANRFVKYRGAVIPRPGYFFPVSVAANSIYVLGSLTVIVLYRLYGEL